MPIVASDIQFRLSGGEANSDPANSIGGAKSSTQVGAGVHNLFDVVSSQESADGDTEYRCIYVHNAHATLTLQNAVIYFSAQSAVTNVAMALDGAVNATAQGPVANENTAPNSPALSFSQPTVDSPLAIGNIPPGQHQAVWIRRTVSAGTPATNNDGVTITVAGDTAA